MMRFQTFLITLGLTYRAAAQFEALEKAEDIGFEKFPVSTGLNSPLSPDHDPHIRIKSHDPPKTQELDPGRLVLTYLAYIGHQWERTTPLVLEPRAQGSLDEQFFPFTRMQLWLYPHPEPAIPSNTQNTAWAVANTLSLLFRFPDIFPIDKNSKWDIPVWSWSTDPGMVVFGTSGIVVDDTAPPVDPVLRKCLVQHEYKTQPIIRNYVMSLITSMSRLIWTYDAATLVADVFQIGNKITLEHPITRDTITLTLIREGTPESPVTFSVLADGLRYMLVELINKNEWMSEDAFFFVQNVVDSVAVVSLRPQGVPVEQDFATPAPVDAAVWKNALTADGPDPVVPGDGGGLLTAPGEDVGIRRTDGAGPVVGQEGSGTPSYRRWRA